MNKYKLLLFVLPFLAALLLAQPAAARQNEKETGHKAEEVTAKIATDSIPKKKQREYNPGKAALRSAIVPGLGQIYNRKYWKVPIVYGALGTTAGIFVYNFKNYRDTRFAYRVKYNMRVNFTDSALYSQIKDVLKPLSESSLRSYRDQFRRDIDYSALFFVIMWGLNVVDAAVDAHLKSFDVSPDLSLRFKPGRSEIAGTTGLSVVLTIGKKPASQVRLLPSQF